MPVAILLLDQSSKLLVYHNITLGREGEIPLLGDFFKLHYLTNPGMAFGLDIQGPYGKWILTILRIGVMGSVIYYLYYLMTRGAARGLLMCWGVILGGAMGNVMDSTFYGVWLQNAPSGAPTPWFHGQVIDMLYIDIWAGFLPESIPIIGGQYVFLWPIFNVADASIFTGMLSLLLFHKRFAKKSEDKKDIEPSKVEDPSTLQVDEYTKSE